MKKTLSQLQRNAWSWIPSLYFAEGLPYVVVMTVSVIMYKRLDISNTDIALYTSWLYLPWVIKPFWSPFVDMVKSKRWWIVSMQLLIGAGFGGIGLLLPLPLFFQSTLCVFWLMAFSSATHDIAADYFLPLFHPSRSRIAHCSGWNIGKETRKHCLGMEHRILYIGCLFSVHVCLSPFCIALSIIRYKKKYCMERCTKTISRNLLQFLQEKTYRLGIGIHDVIPLRRSFIGKDGLSLPVG